MSFLCFFRLWYFTLHFIFPGLLLSIYQILHQQLFRDFIHLSLPFDYIYISTILEYLIKLCAHLSVHLESGPPVNEGFSYVNMISGPSLPWQHLPWQQKGSNLVFVIRTRAGGISYGRRIVITPHFYQNVCPMTISN